MYLNKYFWQKLIGGISILLTSLLLLIGLTNYQDLFPQLNYANQKSQTKLIKSFPRFSLEGNGDLIEVILQPQMRTVFHYRALTVPQLTPGLVPELYLEIKNSDGTISWEQTPIAKIDYQDKKIYFLFKKEEAGQIKLVKNYTGRYKLVWPD